MPEPEPAQRPLRRPFKDKSWLELDQMAKALWDDPSNLKFIEVELGRRSNPAATTVREKVRRRLAETPPESPSWYHTDVKLVLPKPRSTPDYPRYPRGHS